jgi:hypothetical protein
VLPTRRDRRIDEVPRVEEDVGKLKLVEPKSEPAIEAVFID